MAVRLPPVSSRNRSSSRAATCAGDIARNLAAASSMASGMPSSARQIRATAAELPSLTSKSGLTAAARSASSRTEAYPVMAAAPGLSRPGLVPACGSAGGACAAGGMASGWTGSLLTGSAGLAAACTGRPPGISDCSLMPRVASTVGATSAGSVTGAN
jgi:hypothetical protein